MAFLLLLIRWGREEFPAAGDGADDIKRLGAFDDGLGQRRVGRIVGDVLLAGEKSQERAALLRGVVANRSAEHGIARFERVEGRAKRDRAVDFELYFPVALRQRAQMCGQNDADHLSVWTSTERTPGRCSAMADQELPESAEA